MTKLPKIALLGIFEDYSNRATGPSFLTTYNIECGRIKKEVQHTFESECSFVCDPAYMFPAASTFGIKNLDVNLSYLYTQMAMELYRQQSSRPTIVTHSVLDIYAELVLHHGRAKWLEPLLARHLQTYSLLIHVPSRVSTESSEAKYDTIISILMHEFNANYYRLSENEDVIGVIRKHLYESTPAVNQIHGVEAQSNTANTAASSK